MMITIGITGGVGAGKSTVLDFLEEKYQAYVMKADEIGHLVMEPGQSCYEPVIALFGRRIIKNDKTIDRRQASGEIKPDHPSCCETVHQRAVSCKETAGTEDMCGGSCTPSGRSLSGVLRYDMVYSYG